MEVPTSKGRGAKGKEGERRDGKGGSAPLK